MGKQEQWNTKLGFILASAGSAIGLGAIWKFPYIAGTSGGGAFLLIFLLFTVVIGYPLLIGEFVIGRRGQSDAISTYKKLAPNSYWHFIGVIGIVTTFLILSFYSVIGGWIILYIIKVVTGSMNGLSQEQYAVAFGELVANPWLTIAGQFAFIVITIVVIARGVQNGIEKASKVMMPALFILFIILVTRSLMLEGTKESLAFLLIPNFSKVTPETILFALGQAFFTLSLGVSGMVTYASYLPKTQNLPRSALSIIGLNIAIVLLAGLAIFPGVFTFNLQPDEGPTLLFSVLPTVFNQLPFGMLFFIAFLVLFLFAALTSAFSLLEIFVAVKSKQDPIKRKKYAWKIGLAAFVVGIPSCLSFGVMADFHLFGFTVFEFIDYVVSNILMPVGALCISLFLSLRLKKEMLFEEITFGSKVGMFFLIWWYRTIKYVVSPAIMIVLIDLIRNIIFS